MIDFKNKKVAVLGLGVEGLSSARFLVKNGARVTVLDRKNREELIPLLRHSGTEAEGRVRLLDKRGKPRSARRIQNLSGQEVAAARDSGVASLPIMTDVEIIGGKDYLKNLDKFDVIVRSPGVKRNLPEIINAETRRRRSADEALERKWQGSGGQEKGVEITSQTKIFFDLCPCPIIGVTGTKGKGTTATLIYKMLKKSFDSLSTSSGRVAQDKQVYLGGNIGKPPFEFLNKLNPRSWVVLELSSFQLQDLTKSPHVAVVLMITSEHLDYHKDVYEYVEAKRNILRLQTEKDFAIINKDYPASRESDINTSAKVFSVSRESEAIEGCFVRNGKILLQMSFPRKPRQTRRKRESSPRLDRGQIKSGMTEVEIIDIKDILLPGKHNLENVCAAVMAATIIGVSKKNIVKVLKTFKGLEHRLELVGEVNGVRYYDDSFSTTPETAIAAIEAFKNPEILILGGSSKGSDFTELGRVISNAKNIKAIIGIGVEWDKIKLKIIRTNKHLRGGRMDSSEVNPTEMICVEGCKNMSEIVQAASKMATKGDVVLFSPACASFDMFKNYKDRGEQFKEQVLKLKSQN